MNLICSMIMRILVSNQTWGKKGSRDIDDTTCDTENIKVNCSEGYESDEEQVFDNDAENVDNHKRIKENELRQE